MTIVEEALQNYGNHNYEIIAYCLMDNHVHLMIKTDTKPLGLFIARIHSIYTKYFNRKYNYIGHLFQDKYFSELIEDDVQLLETSRYVHLNPVRAKMVSVPNEYRWSSYKILIGEEKERFTNKSLILKYFKDDDKSRLYREFVEGKIKTKETNVIKVYINKNEIAK